MPIRPVPIHAAQDAGQDAVHPTLAGDDLRLVERIRAGDTAAFEAMFHTYYGLLCALAMGYVGSRAEAEEYVQDVFLWVWERRASWLVQGPVRNYLYTAVRNRVLNHLRRQRAIDRWEPATLELRQPPRQADDDLSSHATAAALHQAIARLPERRRQAITLRWQHYLSYADIADLMGISVKAVETTLRKALDQLRRDLDSRL